MGFIVTPKMPEAGQTADPRIKVLANRGFRLETEYQCIEAIPSTAGRTSPEYYLVILNDKNEMKIEDSNEWIYVRKTGKPATKNEDKPSTKEE
jgi:hypothetical protein